MSDAGLAGAATGAAGAAGAVAGAATAAVTPFEERVAGMGRPELLRSCSLEQLNTLQVNITTRCNLRCKHCHVEGSSERTDEMSREHLESCLTVYGQSNFTVLDVTGGAPELHPHYRWFIEEAALLACTKRERGAGGAADAGGAVDANGGGAADAWGVGGAVDANEPATTLSTAPPPPAPLSPGTAKVITRTNLTVLTQERFANLPEVWASLGVEVVCSLPSWEQRNTNRQRGEGVFERAIEGLRLLNEVGYGKGATNSRGEALVLNVVVNPGGAFLPPAQASAEREFKRELDVRYGVSFDHLLAITNNPVGRFASFLDERGKLDDYLKRLADAFNPATVENMMCRSQVSVRWDGVTFDCDFNQALDWPIEDGGSVDQLAERLIAQGAARGVRSARDARLGAGDVRGVEMGAGDERGGELGVGDERGVELGVGDERGGELGAGLGVEGDAGHGTTTRPIRFGNHCYACTAGAGSSCGGTTA